MFVLVFLNLLFLNIIEKINKKRFIIVSLVLSIVSYLLCYIYYNNLKIILLIRIIQGITYTINFSFIFSIAIEIIPAELRVGYLGMFGVSGSIASAVGPSIAEYIFKITNNFRNIFILGLIVSILSLIIFSIIKEYNRVDNEVSNKPINLREYKYIIILSIIFGSIFGAHFSFISDYAKKINVLPVSAFFISYSISLILIRIILVNEINRWEKIKTIKIFFFIAIISLFLEFLLSKIKLLIFLMLTAVTYGLSHSILYPTFSSVFVEKTHERSKATIIFILLFSLGQGISSFFYGFISDIFNYQYMYLISFIISILLFSITLKSNYI